MLARERRDVLARSALFVDRASARRRVRSHASTRGAAPPPRERDGHSGEPSRPRPATIPWTVPLRVAIPALLTLLLLPVAGCGESTAPSPPLDAGRTTGGTNSRGSGGAGVETGGTASGGVSTGGTLGTGGSGGSAEHGDASPGGCAVAAFCDDFERGMPGSVPDPDRWTVLLGCNPNTVNRPASGGGLVVGVDEAQAHGGTRSLRVVGGDTCGYYAVSASAFQAAPGPEVYVRFWARFSGAATQNHNGFLSIPTGGDHLRLGFQNQVLSWNAQQSDATLPEMSPQGTALSRAPLADAWTCIEFHLSASNGHLELWLDGTSVAGLGYAGQDEQGVTAQWSRGGFSSFAPESLGLGWLGLNAQMTAWFDDVAVAGARIGCD